MRIANEPDWLVEGIYVVLVDPLLAAADIIVLLDVAWHIAAWRIVIRHIFTTLRGTNEYPGLRLLIKLLIYAHAFYHNRHNQHAELMRQCLAAQRAIPLPPSTDAMVQHLETYHPVSIPPKIAFMRSYLEKYQDKVVVLRAKADYERLLTRLVRRPKTFA